jgi:hypothetical protein
MAVAGEGERFRSDLDLRLAQGDRKPLFFERCDASCGFPSRLDRWEAQLVGEWTEVARFASSCAFRGAWESARPGSRRRNTSGYGSCSRPDKGLRAPQLPWRLLEQGLTREQMP